MKNNEKVIPYIPTFQLYFTKSPYPAYEILKPLGENSLWVTESKEYARRFGSIVLEFEVPKSYLNKNFLQTGKFSGSKIGVVNKGLHKAFLTKVHK
jgi:hypothetical protein